MTNLPPRLACVLLALATMPLALAGQDSLPERPFVRGGAFDKPYLTRLGGRTAIGGYAEAHARLEREDGAIDERGFEAKRFNIFTATDVSDFVRIGAELEFEDGAEEIKLEFAAIDFMLHPGFALRAGMLLSPLGRFNLSHDSPLNEFTDRPLVSTDLVGVALSEPGLGAFGRLPAGSRGRITYEIYAVNGFHDGLINDSEDGTRIAQGRANFEDNNASPAIVGRVTWSPTISYEFGISVHHGAYNVFNADGLSVDERRDLTIFVVDLEANVASLRVVGEAAFVNLDVPAGLGGVYASDQRGLYLEVLHDFGEGWVSTMPSSYFSVGGRVDLLDRDSDVVGDNTQQLTLGVNFRPTRDTVLKLNYQRARLHDRFNNPGDRAGFLFSIATYF